MGVALIKISLLTGALGTIAGAMSVGVMKLTGTTTEELRYFRHGWKTASNRLLHSFLSQELEYLFLSDPKLFQKSREYISVKDVYSTKV